MSITRRAFIKNGVAAFTVGVTAPAFLSDLARSQAASSSRNLVVLDLSGGNDGLSLLVPYTDAFYYSRRPTLAIPAGQVLQVGTDASGKALGLHPRLTGLRDIFNQGRLALIQRVGYENSSRSHFAGTDIWEAANPANPQGSGWVGRYLATLPAPLDPLIAWNTTGETPLAFQASSVPVASIPSLSSYAFSSPNSGAEAARERAAAASIASHVPIDRPQVAFVGTLNDGLTAFYTDLRNLGLLNDTLLLSFSEFGRRINENGSRGTDHGAASVMIAMGGAVRGGLYGTAPSLVPDPQNPTLENNGNDVHYETDFRSVYARVIDNWLGGDSVAVLGGDFRKSGIEFV
jgi:uncharacterized protein (DUF1501 family)